LIIPKAESNLTLPAKQKSALRNPYYDIWAWSCQNLEWAGPSEATERVKISHHILPVFYHHFGCVCPTYDAISLIAQLSKSKKQGGKADTERPVVEIGSGNGYWAYLLRRAGITVHAVDNAASAWRTTWIGDTIITDGVAFLTSPPQRFSDAVGGKGVKNAVLLLVYPQVGADFTGKVLRAYEGNVICVAGTQNANGFTGFPNELIHTWIARERKDFELVCRIPLPSFAGKDEAFFVFVKNTKA